MNSVKDPIEHVIVLMLENRSFDQMLGSLKAEIADLDGIDPAKPSAPNMVGATPYPQSPGALRVFPAKGDPKHEYPNVKKQIADGAMSGFARDFAESFPDAGPTEIGQVMAYYRPGDLPALHTLARNFTICDRWFASVPGPTWPNRFFAHSGTSLGHLSMPEGLFNLHLHWYNQETIYDRLNAKEIPWHMYVGDVPQSLLFVHQLAPQNLFRYHSLRKFYEDAASASAAETFPAFVFIEPEYYHPGQNDDHPPHDVLNGDHLIASIYNALRSNPALFQKTLLVVVWDEHGGFYDHVRPPDGVEPPDNHAGEFGFDFRRLGVRVPAVLVSPWIGKSVSHVQLDHTSVLRYVVDRWNLAPLGNRVAHANSIGNLLLKAPRKLDELPAPIHAISSLGGQPVPEPQSLNANQHGLVAYSQYLATMNGDDPARAAERNAFMMTSARAQIDTACDHVDRFLASGHAMARSKGLDGQAPAKRPSGGGV